ncbi:MAG: hypothetical protein COY75_10880 [Nitrospirae bacterium CG_4_10_14_0_8_um_filter_41_23]|nr:MAG: hypothetical protein COV68_04905 [Nitrospirae bacterium CG11_big_fil_rev_8_21_14_0_20_41_14]PIY85908.1 MAG: hypothetical protein COY75_10880 [Nitrospirae bacterium CG_4_10_14_0_8_um_filter_41_23]PJA79169.1 MAG: hypothetical protein CO148_08850 [Nitrospirae bacterium CG_4_9_14_3_um_filter_41_27]
MWRPDPDPPSFEFYNPGGLPEDITPQNITEKQYSRNPIIAKVLAKVKYIEELGEGWNKIIKEHQTHPLKPKKPRIKSDKYTSLITVFSTKDKFEKVKEIIELNERQKQGLEYVKERGSLSNKEYRKLFSEITDRTVLNDLKDLVKKGILRGVGKTKAARYYLVIPK